MQATTTQDTTILQLPQELLEHVACYLGPEPAKTPRYSELRDIRDNFPKPPRTGLLELSATCKELRTRLKKLIATLYFQSKTILIANAWSLDALLGIAAHPYFSKTVKHIDFCLTKLEDAVEGHPHCNRDEECFTLNRERETYAMPKLDGGRAMHQAARDNIATLDPHPVEWCRQSIVSQNNLLNGSGLALYLNQVFTDFKIAENIPSLAINNGGLELAAHTHFTFPSRRYRPLGLGRIVNSLPRGLYGYFFETDVCDRRALVTFCQAIADNQYPVTSLEIGDGEIGVSLLSSGLFYQTTGFDNLRELKLALELVDFEKPGHEDRLIANLPQFISFLRVPQNLETLAMTIAWSALDRDSSFSVFTAIADEVTSGSEERALRNIRELELSDFSFDFDQLVACIRATRATLKCLRVKNDEGYSESLWRFDDDCGPKWKKEVLEAYGGLGLELMGNVWTSE